MALRKAITENGVVVGRSSGIPCVTVFKGIPYAAPPVGELRWKAPQPVKNWEGEYKAFNFDGIRKYSFGRKFKLSDIMFVRRILLQKITTICGHLY